MASKMYGIDLSHWNGAPLSKLTSAEASVDAMQFLIAKATQGKAYKDKMFDTYMEYANTKGLLRGAYHFVTEDDVDAQAVNFISTIRPYGDTIPILDYENSVNVIAVSQTTVDGILLPLAEAVIKYTSTPPVIYASQYVFNSLDLSKIAKLGCGAWVAKYDGTETNVSVKNWKTPCMRQYSSSGLLKEFSGKIDLDVAFMSKSAWARYANPRLYK